MKITLAVILLIVLSGCASTQQDIDPFESYNRAMWDFNQSLDSNIVKPVSVAYQDNVPKPIQKGASNFFSNVGDIGVLVNNLLQLKLGNASSDLGRLLVNSTLGLAGLFDPATSMGLIKNNEDFGQTLGYWGVDEGPFVMLPLFGPSTLRDTAAFPLDLAIDPIFNTSEDRSRISLAITRIIDLRVKLLPLDAQVNTALDPYVFVRDSYLQNRRFRVYDGDLPFEDDFDCDPDYEDCD